VLRIPALRQLTPARQRNLLRYSLRRCGLPLPPSAVLERILAEAMPAREDAMPCVAWAGAEVRRYRDRLHLLPPLAPIPEADRTAWEVAHPLTLPGLGTLRATPARGQGFKVSGRVEIGFRAGGERCRPAGRGHHHPLKKLLQEADLPPWERDRLPLVFVDSRLAAVADLWVCDPFGVAPHETGMVLSWERSATGSCAKGK
jgi:tRNA(Ile)-lysidine synthase